MLKNRNIFLELILIDINLCKLLLKTIINFDNYNLIIACF